MASFYAICVHRLFFIHPDDGIYKLRKWARGRKMFTLSFVQCPSSFLPLSYNISHGEVGRLFCFTRTFPTDGGAAVKRTVGYLSRANDLNLFFFPRWLSERLLRSLVKPLGYYYIFAWIDELPAGAPGGPSLISVLVYLL